MYKIIVYSRCVCDCNEYNDISIKITENIIQCVLIMPLILSTGLYSPLIFLVHAFPSCTICCSFYNVNHYLVCFFLLSLDGEYKPDYDFKVVTHAVLHRDFCIHVSRWPCNRKPLDLPRIYLPKTKVKICNCQLHCRGLDMDFYERNATFTAVIQLPPKLFDSIHELTIDIDVNVYEGRVGPKVPLLSSAKQRIKANKETKGVVHIVVNKIVHLDKIVYSNRCPKHIGLEIKASLAVVNYSDSESSLGTPVVDSGCVDMSKSHSIGV